MEYYIYARVSSKDQDVKDQLKRLVEYTLNRYSELKYKDIQCFKEKKSGKSAKERIQFRRMLDEIAITGGGKTVVVQDVSRISRNVKDGVIFKDFCLENDVVVAGVSETIDFTTASGRAMFHVALAFAEYHRDVSLEKTLLGIARAKAAGKFKGRKPGSKNKPKIGRPKGGRK